MGSCPTQAVLPLVGLAAEKVIRDRYKQSGSTMPEDLSFNPVEGSLTPMSRFEEYLRSRGMRNTEQRRVLVQYVFSQHDHFDADALIEKLPKKGERGYVSRPTVYRTLNEFVDAGLLRKFELAGRAVYEHDYGYPQHDHFYCQSCQRLIEFQSAELIELRDRVAHDHGFTVAGHRLIISGICQTCSQAQRKRRRRQRAQT
ncbi:MAG: Fur family transcriptional regulator [Planctomycetota bacterium]